MVRCVPSVTFAAKNMKDQEYVPNVLKSNPAYIPLAVTMILEALSRPSASEIFVVEGSAAPLLALMVVFLIKMIVVLILSIVVHQQVGVAADHAAQIVDATIVAPQKSPSAAVRMNVVILKKNNVVVVMVVMHSAAIGIGTAVPAIIPVHFNRVTSV